MLRHIIAFLFFALLVSSLHAQEFRSGLRLGANASQIDGDRMAGFNKLGMVGGLYVAYPFNDKWSGQFEMLFSQKGSKRIISVERVDSGAWNMLRLDYIEVPVMVQYAVNDKLSLQAGLGGAYLFNTSFEDLFAGLGKADFIKKLELSGTVGAAYRFSDRMSVYGRYTNSLLPINKASSNYYYITYGSGLISMVVSFGLYYDFVRNDQ